MLDSPGPWPRPLGQYPWYIGGMTCGFDQGGPRALDFKSEYLYSQILMNLACSGYNHLEARSDMTSKTTIFLKR